ncbi:Ubiquitin-like protein 3, partial [Chelonia mydas]
NVPFSLQINLRLILVSGKTKEFLFSPNDSAADIAKHVYDNWPMDWEEEQVSSPNILRLIYQGRFLHGNVTLGALKLPFGKTTVMHLVARETLPEPNSQELIKLYKIKFLHRSCIINDYPPLTPTECFVNDLQANLLFIVPQGLAASERTNWLKIKPDKTQSCCQREMIAPREWCTYRFRGVKQEEHKHGKERHKGAGSVKPRGNVGVVDWCERRCEGQKIGECSLTTPEARAVSSKSLHQGVPPPDTPLGTSQGLFSESQMGEISTSARSCQKPGRMLEPQLTALSAQCSGQQGCELLGQRSGRARPDLVLCVARCLSYTTFANKVSTTVFPPTEDLVP